MDLKAVAPDLTAGIEHKLRQERAAKPGGEVDARTRASARKVATEFEAMFTGMMLKSMRSTTGADPLTGGGRAEEIYRSLLDQEYAMAIAKGGSLGLAETIEKQLLDNARQTNSSVRRGSKGNP